MLDILLKLSAITALVAISSFTLTLLYIRHRSSKGTADMSKRGMFKFSDGLRFHYVDPIKVMMDIEAHPEFRMDIHPKLATRGNKDAVAVMKDAIKHAFSVCEYVSPKKAGLTTNEMLELFFAFYSWADFQKKSTQSMQTSAQSTESTPSEYEPATTSDTSGSG